jgi:hypothetical protein
MREVVPMRLSRKYTTTYTCEEVGGGATEEAGMHGVKGLGAISSQIRKYHGLRYRSRTGYSIDTFAILD